MFSFNYVIRTGYASAHGSFTPFDYKKLLLLIGSQDPVAIWYNMTRF